MNRSDEPLFDARIADWLENDPHAAPDQALDIVLAAFPSIKQRRAMRAPWRLLDMSSPLKLAFGVAAIAVLVGGVLFLGPWRPAANVAAGPTASPSASPSAVTTTPSPELTSPPGLTGLIAFSRVNLGSATIMVTAPDGSGTSSLISGLAQNVQPAWSPDGTKIAWATMSGIRVARADGTGGVSLTNDGRDRNPAWSPDGSLIVFASSRDGGVDLYTQPVGGGDLKRLTEDAAEDNQPSWSAITNRIAFASARGGTHDIWTMKPDGSDLAQLTGAEGQDEAPAWSPDGSKIAFASNRDGGTSFIYLMNADGSGVERLSTGANAERDPAWSPDGRFVVFARSDSNSVLVIVDVSTREVVNTMSQARTEWSYPAWRKP